jgi:hypothetical protein
MVGACGISCEVCRKNIDGTCIIGRCAPGSKALEKLAKQKETLGFTCPILECAFREKVEYCLRDCEKFPCEIYYEKEFPYSRSFLEIFKK